MWPQFFLNRVAAICRLQVGVSLLAGSYFSSDAHFQAACLRFACLVTYYRRNQLVGCLEISIELAGPVHLFAELTSTFQAVQPQSPTDECHVSVDFLWFQDEIYVLQNQYLTTLLQVVH